MDRVDGYVDPCLPEIVRLALLIVKEFLGEIPEKVCEVLLKGGPQPLREICMESGLTKREACNAIIVLVQHGFAAALLQEEVIGPRKLLTQYVYKADAQRIIQVLRQPRMLMHISDTMGEWAERVMEILMENGQLTFEGIVQRLSAKCDLTEAVASAHASRSVVLLVRDLYLEQAPPCDLPLTTAPDPRKPKRKTKGKQDEKDQLQSAHELTISQYEKMRFKVPPAVISAQVQAAVAEDDDDGAAAMQVDVAAPQDEGIVLLRINVEAFAKVFRHQACVDIISDRYGRSAGLVVKAMLDLSRPREVGPKEPKSAWVSVGNIIEQLNRIAAAAQDPTLKPSEPPESILAELCDADVTTVEMNDDGLWCVATHSIISMVQFQAINGYLKQRFGQRGLRVWRLLLLEHFLQAEHIEKEAMINTRDVRKLVYAMLKAGYVNIQEIPKSAEHAPSKTIYTYGVVYMQTHTQLVTDLYKAAGNILSRCQFEMEREKEVLELASRKTRGDAIKMSSAQLKAAQRLQGVVRALHTSLLHLDEMVLTMSF